ETPNYTITRLRHDELLADDEQVSYKMVEQPEEESLVLPAAQLPKPARQQAAVQGITPGQPAPIVSNEPAPPAIAEPAAPGFWEKILAWFREAPVAPAVPVAAAPAARPPRRDGQRDSTMRRGRRDQPRGEGRPEGRGP